MVYLGSGFGWTQLDPFARAYALRTTAPASRQKNKDQETVVDFSYTRMSVVNNIGFLWQTHGLFGLPKKVMTEVDVNVISASDDSIIKVYDDSLGRIQDTGSAKLGIRAGFSVPIGDIFHIHNGYNLFHDFMGGDSSIMRAVSMDIGGSLISLAFGKDKNWIWDCDLTVSDIPFTKETADYNMTKIKIETALFVPWSKKNLWNPTFRGGMTIGGLGKEHENEYYGHINIQFERMRYANVSFPWGIGYDFVRGFNVNAELKLHKKYSPAVYVAAYPFSRLPSITTGLKLGF